MQITQLNELIYIYQAMQEELQVVYRALSDE